MTFLSRVVTPRGDSVLKGINNKEIVLSYYWQQVPDTNFSVCVVVAAGYQNSSVTWQPSRPYPSVYMMDYQPINSTNPVRCNQLGRIALRSKTTVKLAPKAFIQPSSFIDIQYTDDVHQQWIDYLEGRTRTSDYIKNKERGFFQGVTWFTGMYNNFKEGKQSKPRAS